MNREELLRRVRALSSDKREGFLDEHCGEDAELRLWVQQQLETLTDANANVATQQVDASSDPDGASDVSINSDEPILNTDPSEGPTTLDLKKEPASQQGKRIGPYKILDSLGEGGMGTVYLAEQKEPVARRVALKVIKAEAGSKEVLARFEAERQAMAIMNHPNIARILDAGTTPEGQPFFAMELVQGQPITTYCDLNRLSIDDRLKLFCDVCAGVQHAHQKGIIHRDLKPTNILVAVVDGKPVAKVIDFGLAKAMESTQKLTDQSLFTGIGQILGTIKYMSPEQAGLDAVDIDTRTDIYAMGIILYELLTGKTPLDSDTIKGEAVLKVLELIRDKEPSRPSSQLSHSDAESLSKLTELRRTDSRRIQKILAGDLDWIVMKALEKDRSRRYESASGFADDIQRYLTDEPVEARPPSMRYRAQKFVRKHRAGVLAASLVAIALLGGIAGTSWSLLLASKRAASESAARKEADRASEKAIKARDSETRQRQLAEAERNRANQKEQEATAAKQEAEFALEQMEATLARSNYYLANARWRERRPGDAISLLQQIPQQHRQFEWYLDRRLFEGSYLTLYDEDDSIHSVALNSTGQLAASGSLTGTIRIWNTVTGNEIRSFQGHGNKVTSMAFSPDDSLLLTTSIDKLLKLWDPESGTEVRVMEGHSDEVYDVAFDPSGQRIVSGSKDATVRLWNASSGETIRVFDLPKDIFSVGFSPDGSRLAAGSYQTVTLWDAESLEELLEIDTDHGTVYDLEFSPDGRSLATAGSDGAVRVWDSEMGAAHFEFREHEGPVYSLSFSPCGIFLASAGEDYTVRLWDMTQGVPAGALIGHDERIRDVQFGAHSLRLISGSLDETVRIWNSDGERNRVLRGHLDRITCVAFSSDNRLLASGSADNSIKIWDLARGQIVSSLVGHDQRISSIRFVSGQSVLVSLSDDRTVKTWDAMSGEQLTEFKLQTRLSIRGVTLSPDGELLAVALVDGSVVIWSTTDAKELRTIQVPAAHILALTFNANGSMLACSSGDRKVIVMQTSNGQMKRSFSMRPTPATRLRFSSDDKCLAAATLQGPIKLLDMEHGGEAFSLDGHKRAVAVSFSPDGKRLASSDESGEITLWDSASGEEIRSLARNRGLVSCVEFSPDGRTLAAGSLDRTVRLWEAPIGEETRYIRSSPFLKEVGFDREGSVLVARNQKDEELVWDVESGIATTQRPEGEVIAGLRSADGRWRLKFQSLFRGTQLLLVDTWHKERPTEQAIREFQAKNDPFRHLHFARYAESKDAWFAAAFHRAWVLKTDMDDRIGSKSARQEAFLTAYENLVAQQQSTAGGLEPVVPAVVREVLREMEFGETSKQ